MCAACSSDGWRLPHPPGQHWLPGPAIGSHTATNLFWALHTLADTIEDVTFHIFRFDKLIFETNEQTGDEV